MSTNSDLKAFAVFVNSKSAVTRTTEKSTVSIPFVSNLAYHDPMRVFKFSMVDMLFTNCFFNVRAGYNKLKILVKWAAGRGKAASEEVIVVDVPFGNYDVDTLSSYLNQTIGKTETISIQYGLTTVNIDLYYGFGAAQPGPNTVIQFPVDASYPNTSLLRIIMQSACLGMYTQAGTDIVTVPTIELAHSYIYEGIYLIADAETDGLLHTLGFFNDTEPVPKIPNSAFSGYGFQFAASTLNSIGSAPTNTVYYTIANQDGYARTSTGADDETTMALTPDTMTDLSGLDELYIHCPQLRTQFMSSQNRSKVAPSEVIAVIPINVPFGQKMNWQPQFPLTSTLINTNITQLDFRLTNSNNVPLDFQGSDWSMTLFCNEEEDSSKYQFEDTGTQATPFQVQQNAMNAGSYMEERRLRKRLNRNT